MKFTAPLALPVLLLAAPASAAVFNGNGNSGFGGILGTGSLELTVNAAGDGLDGVFSLGTGGFNDEIVLYLDTVPGGFSDTSSFTDQGDLLRKAISGQDGTARSTVNFPSGFDADYAIALNDDVPSDNQVGFIGLWQLDNPANFTFAGALDPPAAVTEFSVAFSDLGISTGDEVRFIGTYLNGNGAFRSDEAIGGGIPNGNIGTNPITFTAFESFVVPEPASIALLLGGLPLLARRRG